MLLQKDLLGKGDDFRQKHAISASIRPLHPVYGSGED